MAIDLNDFEVGTLFRYDLNDTWCRDGQAILRERGPARTRVLADTYWSVNPTVLTPCQVDTARVSFVPSQHREVNAHDAQVYPEGAVVTVAQHHGYTRRYYVRTDQPALTSADRLRHERAKCMQALSDAQEAVSRHQATIFALDKQIRDAEQHS